MAFFHSLILETRVYFFYVFVIRLPWVSTDTFKGHTLINNQLKMTLQYFRIIVPTENNEEIFN